MTFKKFISLENSYREKYINRMVDYYPHLLDEQYVITEKIDGSNFQWAFFPDGVVRAGSRNSYLDINGSFQGANIQQLYEAHYILLSELLEWAVADNVVIRLYGELHGQGIQKRVDYGPEKKLLYFAMTVDEQWLSFYDFENIMVEYGGDGYIVPIIEIANSLQDALDFNTKFNSLLSDGENNLTEGVVIQPYANVYPDQNGSPFVIKKKNSEFDEQKVKTEKIIDPTVAALNSQFKAYINESRVLSVFSKDGEISSPKEIGKYIKLILEDAKVDFEKDFGDELIELDKTQLKDVFNVGSLVANLLKGYL